MQIKAGDWLIIVLSLLGITWMFIGLWHHAPASQLKVSQADKVVGIYDLNQTRALHLQGPLGLTHISIEQGKVRFKHSPCNRQYCVHQGWLNKAGQVAICLPNQVSIQLIGAQQPYDSLNY